MVSVGGNEYSVPDTTRSRKVEVQQYPNEIQIFEDKRLIAVHALLTGRGQRQVQRGHRQYLAPASKTRQKAPEALSLLVPGQTVHRRSLAVYEAVGQALAAEAVR